MNIHTYREPNVAQNLTHTHTHMYTHVVYKTMKKASLEKAYTVGVCVHMHSI